MTAFDVTLEQIRDEARQLDPGKVALTLVAAPLFALGWVAAKVAGVLWLVGSWMWVALLVGWRTAKG